MTSEARAAAGEVRDSPWVSALGRFGWLAVGGSFALVGVLALKLAFGEGGSATSREGALARIASESFGKVLLILLAIGFAGYALWRFVEALLDRSNEGDRPKGLAKRAKSLGIGVVYAGLTFTAIKILAGSGASTSQNREARKTTAEILSWPKGTWIVGFAGLCLIAAGLTNGYRGVTQKFAESWKTGEMSTAARTWAIRIGTVGWLARMVVFGLIGVFLIKAAVEYDPQDAIGLDGALQKLAQQSYGSWLLGLVAVGLIAYALYCLVEARFGDV